MVSRDSFCAERHLLTVVGTISRRARTRPSAEHTTNDYNNNTDSWRDSCFVSGAVHGWYTCWRDRGHILWHTAHIILVQQSERAQVALRDCDCREEEGWQQTPSQS